MYNDVYNIKNLESLIFTQNLNNLIKVPNSDSLEYYM